MSTTRLLAAAVLVSALATSAFAGDVKLGDLTILAPWSRATPKGADVAVGYLVIRNDGAAPDMLTGGSAAFADAVELHEMSVDKGVMRMREFPDGLVIPAHGQVTLKPNGFHLMFAGLKRALIKGETVKVSLTFAHAGAISVDFPVRAIGAAGPAGGATGGMKM